MCQLPPSAPAALPRLRSSVRTHRSLLLIRWVFTTVFSSIRRLSLFRGWLSQIHVQLCRVAEIAEMQRAESSSPSSPKEAHHLASHAQQPPSRPFFSRLCSTFGSAADVVLLVEVIFWLLVASIV